MLLKLLIFCLLLYTIYVIKKVLDIIYENGEPVRTVAWILVIIFIPFMGLFLYHLVGKNIKKERKFKEKYLDDHILYQNKLAENFGQVDSSFDDESIKNIKLVKLLDHNGNAPITYRNKVEILNDGRATFEAIHAAISQATTFIHLEYYILLPGKIADDLFAQLAEKVKEGVAVRVIYDGVGSWQLTKKYVEKLTAQGIEIFPFMPVRFGPIANRINYRNHRKIMVIDGNIGFTGGINVADKYVFGDDVIGHWHDVHFKITGPAVQPLNTIFLQDWYFTSKQKIQPPSLPPPANQKGHAIQIVASGPDSKHAIIQQEYFTIINEAKEYIYITTPYFIPGTSIIEALKVAAISGVEVILLLPDESDSRILKWSVRSYLEDLLDAGVRIFLYQQGFLHSKTIIADDYFASIGTANVDQRSFNQNFEVNAMIYSSSICLELKTLFFKDLSDSRELNYDQFHRRPVYDKLLESTARLLSPLL